MHIANGNFYKDVEYVFRHQENLIIETQKYSTVSFPLFI